MIFRTDINFKKQWKSVLKVPIPFEVIPNESIFVHAADQFFISEAAEPATNWDGGGLSILWTTLSHDGTYVSTMGRQEIRVISTRQGDEVPLLPSPVVENSWLPLFDCL